MGCRFRVLGYCVACVLLSVRLMQSFLVAISCRDCAAGCYFSAGYLELYLLSMPATQYTNILLFCPLPKLQLTSVCNLYLNLRLCRTQINMYIREIKTPLINLLYGNQGFTTCKCNYMVILG